MERKFAAAAFALLVCLFVAFVWPTLFVYDHVQRGAFDLLIRRNRVTGHMDYLDPMSGWVETGRPVQAAGASQFSEAPTVPGFEPVGRAAPARN